MAFYSHKLHICQICRPGRVWEPWENLRPRRGVVQITGSEKMNFFMPGLAGPEYMDVWEHREISSIARSSFGRKVEDEDEDVFFHPDKE